jgi:hypothetical protein
MKTLFAVTLSMNLCGTSGGQVGSPVGEVYRGNGYVMRLPSVGAKVAPSADKLSIDAKDFSRFYDIYWTDWNPADPSVPVTSKALKECDPAVWDVPVVTETTWTASALCTRRERFEWLIGRVEKHGDRALVFFYVANRDFLAYEDVWVDFANTAGSITAADDVLPPFDEGELRKKIRAGAKNVKPSLSPLPGGRVMSGAVIPVLEPVWERRKTLAPPPQKWL